MAKASNHFAGGVTSANVAGSYFAAPWPPVQGSHYYAGTPLNVVWQNTSSNATYCTASSALSSQG